MMRVLKYVRKCSSDNENVVYSQIDVDNLVDKPGFQRDSMTSSHW